MKRLLDLMLDRPLTVLMLFLVGAAALGWQARHFEVDASAETLLTRDNKLYIRTQVMNERFSPQEFLMVAYAPKNHPVLSQQTFRDIASLSQHLLELERVESVRSILNVPLLSLMDDPMTAGDPSDWTYENRQFSPAQMRRAFNGHPIYENLVINEDQTATAIQVLFEAHPKLEEIESRINDIRKNALKRELTGREQQQIEELQAQAEPIEQRLNELRMEEIAQIRAMLGRYESRAQIYLGGAHVLGYQLIDIIMNDLMVFGGIIAAVVCLVLLFLFRRLRWVLVPLTCCACSVLLTVGLFGLLGFKATVISANFIALQLILTLAITIHLIVQYREYASAHPNWSQRELIRQTFRKKVKPCFYAGLTTSVGFGSLLFTGIQPVIAFGWMMIIAMFFSISVSLILFPALMTLFKRETPSGRQSSSRLLLHAFTHASRFPRTTLVVSGTALVLGIAGLFFLNVENSFINYFDESTRVHQELRFIDQQMGGSTPLDIMITAPPEARNHPELVVTAGAVQELQRVQKMLREQHGMGKVLSIVNFTELAKQINQGKPLTEYELTALYRSLSSDLRQSLVGSFYSEQHSQSRISTRVKDATAGLDRGQLLKDIDKEMAALGIPEERYAMTNLFVLYQDILQRLFQSQIYALGLVYLVLTLTFCLIFRSVRIGIIGAIPNVLSTLSILGIMGWFGIPLDLMTITIASIAMGIAVDDTIHYVDRYLDEFQDADGQTAVRRTNFSVGFAVIYTSTIVILGFSLLIFSDFVPSVQFGLLTSVAMAMALAWNLSLLPVLLHKFVRHPA